MLNVYNKPGSTPVDISLKNNTASNMASGLDACEIGVETDTGLLGHKDQNGNYSSSAKKSVLTVGTVPMGKAVATGEYEDSIIKQSSSKIGINNASPTKTLDITGTLQTSDIITCNGEGVIINRATGSSYIAFQDGAGANDWTMGNNFGSIKTFRIWANNLLNRFFKISKAYNSTIPAISVDVENNRLGVNVDVPNHTFEVNLSSASATPDSTNTVNVANVNTTVGNYCGIKLSMVSAGDSACIGAVHTDRTGGTRDSDIVLHTLDSSVISEKVRIKSTGKAGFGISAPLAPIHIKSNDTTSANPTAIIDNGGTLDNEVSLDLKGSMSDSVGPHRVGRISGKFVSPGNSYTCGALKIQTVNTGDTLVDAATFRGGKVGIQTDSPATPLDVNGQTTIRDIPHATTDTDKFIASDSGVIKYRTGSELLSDIGAAASAHTHSSIAAADGNPAAALSADNDGNIAVGAVTQKGIVHVVKNTNGSPMSGIHISVENKSQSGSNYVPDPLGYGVMTLAGQGTLPNATSHLAFPRDLSSYGYNKCWVGILTIHYQDFSGTYQGYGVYRLYYEYSGATKRQITDSINVSVPSGVFPTVIDECSGSGSSSIEITNECGDDATIMWKFEGGLL